MEEGDESGAEDVIPRLEYSVCFAVGLVWHQLEGGGRDATLPPAV